jgi:hypothetical protein
MKKLYSAIFIFLFAGTISAQAYFPMLDSVNNWHNITNFIPVRINPISASQNCTYPVFYVNDLEEYTTQDSVINSFTYKMVYATADGNITPCFIGFMREDTAARKVYFLDNLSNPEILLYDFSMIPGNTINISFTVNNGYLPNGTFTLDSIRSIHISAGNRRIFYLNNHAVPFSPNLVWIESVGATLNAFYPVCMNQYGFNQYQSCMAVPHDATEFLTCFDHATKIYYDSCAYHEAIQDFCFQVTDTCNYHNICGDVHEIPSLTSFEISPNPSSGKCQLAIEVSQKKELSVIVWDITGKNLVKENPLGIIPAGKAEKEIDLSSLPDGIYFVGLRSGDNAVYRKVIIRH